MLSNACAIPDDEMDTVTLTGGLATQHLVHMYGPDGFSLELPRLRQGRHSHACGVYWDTAGSKVGTRRPARLPSLAGPACGRWFL